MRTHLSLRIARLLLVAAAAMGVGLAAYIAAATSDVVRASPWLALILATAAGFALAAYALPATPGMAKAVAVASAIAMTALGVTTGFGAGQLSFPAAAVGVLAAWAAVLTPPRRALVIAFLLYVAIGLAYVGLTVVIAAGKDTPLLYPMIVPQVLIWPVWIAFAALGAFTGR